jgi:LysR family glycine cleavage system transcriptional activator
MTDPDWRRLPSLSALRAFEAAARLGGFSAAGRALNVTHAAVAQAVRGLEAELGLALLRRDGRGLALTEDGERLARSLREGFGTVAAGVEALRAGERGRGLRVTATPAFAQSVLMPRLGDFWRHHPEVTVSVTPSPDLADLRRDGFDLAIRSGRGGWPGVEAELLVEARFLLAGTPGLLARDPDIARLPWILDRRAGARLDSADAWERGWLKGAGLNPDALAVTGIDSPMLAVPAALAGYGLIFVTDVVVAADLAAGRLKEVPFPGLPRMAYWTVMLPGPRRPALGRFLDWLRAEFAGPGSPSGAGAGADGGPDPSGRDVSRETPGGPEGGSGGVSEGAPDRGPERAPEGAPGPGRRGR